MTRNSRIVLSVVSFAALMAAAFYLAQHGTYGWTLFIVLPILAGGLGSWSFRPTSAGHAISIGAISGFLGCALFLLGGLEGFVCVLMALPVVLTLAIAGSLLAYWLHPSMRSRSPVAMALLMPLSMFFDLTAEPPVYSVTTRMVVNATPERIWKNVVAFPDIRSRPDWVLRTGVAYPIGTRIEGTGAGVTRSCELSTGTVQERVLVWDKPRLLGFVVTATPPAMREMGLYGPIYPKHLNGFYIGKMGQFALTPLPGRQTLVVGTSWYQHGLWPAEYWRWWTDTAVHHIHHRVLEHIRELSESEVDVVR